jgi:hypothetical protein
MHQKQPPAKIAVRTSASLAGGASAAPAPAGAEEKQPQRCHEQARAHVRNFRQFFGARHELQGHAVVAVALAGGLGTIVEDVPLMAAAAGAVILGARIDQLEVGRVATAPAGVARSWASPYRSRILPNCRRAAGSRRHR